MFSWILTHSPLLYFTQSLWRDEVFSIFVAQKPIAFILQNLTFEPPVYYLLLHYWIRLFGTSEIAVRSLSLLGFSLATIVVIYWSEQIFDKHWLSWVTPILFFTNPMLLYYAFEIRTYGWYTLFAVLALFAYARSRWRLWVLSTILGFYTHTFFLFFFLAQMLHWTFVNRHKLTRPFALIREPMVAGSLLITSAMLPWIIRILREAGTLKDSWYFPVNGNLVRSVLGNMYLGYEGTPWYLWGFTANLSLMLLVMFILAIRDKKTRNRNALFLFTVIVPLTIVIGVSFIKPLFVNRYLIGVTVAEIFLIAFAIESIKNHTLQKIFALCSLLFALGFNVWYPSQHPKLNIRATIQEVNAMKASGDIILARSPLIFFETIYYAKPGSRVYLYNPHNNPFPWYVGGILVSQDQMTSDLPVYPTRAFLIDEDGSYTISYRAPLVTLAKIQ
ncbi:hypothetical protein HY949_04570 [Candidatus Gottesmanbacteria bacterium]|nr:hypothetical protein [Candidatus Gottesmanbacteria bacterium]